MAHWTTRQPPCATLFPYTTLFRSVRRPVRGDRTGGAPGAVAGSSPRLDTDGGGRGLDRKSTRLNSSHVEISYAGFCLKKKPVNGHGTSRAGTAGQTIEDVKSPARR